MAEKKFDLIVFDWDGTLMDSTALIVDSIRAACMDMGVAVPSRAQAAHVIGLSLVGAMREVAPGLDEAEVQELARRYRAHYLARDNETVLFEGTRELLELLCAEGYTLAIATGKARAGLDRVLASSGLAPLFQATRCADESFSKPHPGMLLDLMDRLVVDPERTLMVGDTTHDLLMARSAGVSAVAVTCGAHPEGVLRAESPAAVLPSVASLGDWLACAT
ncbi:MAG: HAD family hydrolase [Candidatus Dactylopiibacterium carminicum]|uniref:HAD family hydrolase n=1 Tax=Candidatus Dactylopiibacterium carminicum TaxID=857335 RepID=A0A272ESN9_9RHOO|nr:HAD-IIIA family hydrolase [Candidatus Dactylopiibacterium carminicum]KAF7599106.1 HAD family hydrolase [Candidatus Dactylopiibacterium carminicum]PAS93133.1 MAG: HAD family hydrolase [Candidatus Dactylopiibacterium carminicum]PAS96895.1 MAG: HAD family hydrolase [Candidatus Dactylopiibacterium carminicum]PAS99119.1 MAG: HAD family hydrolase [Candidatus Dactylopiibacterium carminicum]